MSVAGALLGAVGLLAAACSSTSSTGQGGGAPAGSGATGGAVSSDTAKAGAAVVSLNRGPGGSYLTGAHGRALYMFASDSATRSTCLSTCLTYWPALTGTPRAGAGVTAAQLGTISGTHQITYAGHPLYYFAEDTAAGEISGQGRDDFGAKWWLLAPSGAPITGAPNATQGSGRNSSTAGSGGGGYGGGGY